MPVILYAIIVTLTIIIIIQVIYIYAYAKRTFPFFILPLKIGIPNKKILTRHKSLIKIAGSRVWSYIVKEDELRLTAFCKNMFPDMEAEIKSDIFIVKNSNKT